MKYAIILRRENYMINTELIEKIRYYVRGAVDDSRYAHSVRTAETARKLCKKYKLNEIDGYLAGLAHDMCKNMPDEVLLSFAKQDGALISSIEQEKPSLLHGRAAAVVLQKQFGIENEDILEAIRHHTFGGIHLCDLAKIIYISDKIEPGRSNSSPEYIKKLLKKKLNKVVFIVLESSIMYLKSKNKEIVRTTWDWYLELLKKQNPLVKDKQKNYNKIASK